MSSRLTLVIADPHDLYRAGLRSLLEAAGAYVLAEATTPKQALEMVTRHAPAVVLIDIAAEGFTDRDAIRAIADSAPATALVALTSDTSDASLARAFAAGVRGYALKSTPHEALVEGLNAVRAGEGYLAPPVARRVVDLMHRGAVPASAPPPSMSERELDVLRLLAEGIDNNAIAERLSISSKTVKNHVASILLKLELNNRVQAAVFAVRNGLA